MATYTDERTGIVASGSSVHVDAFAAACAEMRREEAAWIADLRARGFAAAHPDDGWVDRKENTIHFAYADFNDGAGVGSLVALGRPEKWLAVRLTAFRRWVVGLEPNDGDWSYEPVEPPPSATTTAKGEGT